MSKFQHCPVMFITRAYSTEDLVVRRACNTQTVTILNYTTTLADFNLRAFECIFI